MAANCAEIAQVAHSSRGLCPVVEIYSLHNEPGHAGREKPSLYVVVRLAVAHEV